MGLSRGEKGTPLRHALGTTKLPATPHRSFFRASCSSLLSQVSPVWYEIKQCTNPRKNEALIPSENKKKNDGKSLLFEPPSPSGRVPATGRSRPQAQSHRHSPLRLRRPRPRRRLWRMPRPLDSCPASPLAPCLGGRLRLDRWTERVLLAAFGACASRPTLD